jgi:hypothetical protein
MPNHYAMGLLTKGFICPSMEQIVNTVQLSPDASQNLLAKALTLPLPDSMTQAQGIHQSDVVIRTALTMAIADLRANPWLLKSIFQSLLEDAQTAQVYGEKERQRAIDWFKRTDIPVVMDYHMGSVEGSCISISLVESSEAEKTLGDVHYEPREDVEAYWPPLTEAFTPESYSAATGIMALPQSLGDSLVVATTMVIIDKVGREHPIKEVLDRYTIVLTEGTVADFNGALIKGAKPRFIQELESMAFKETYRIGVHTHGEPITLTWLYSIVKFCLLRYKQALLEARGFERSVTNWSQFAKNEAFGRENYWTRFCTITGYVRDYWPKALSERALSSQTQLKVTDNANRTTYVPQDGYTEEDSPWLATDGIGIKVEEE